jgi:hypothetical protein
MPWGIHFGWNTVLGLVFGLPVSGLTDFSVIVKSRALGPKWLTGGAYGIEGGALGTIVIVLGLLPMLWFTRNGRFCAEPVADGRALSQPNNAASGSADHSSNPGIQL